MVTAGVVTLEETLGVAEAALALVIGGVTPEGAFSASLMLTGGVLMSLC